MTGGGRPSPRLELADELRRVHEGEDPRRLPFEVLDGEGLAAAAQERRTAGEPGDVDGRLCRGDGRMDVVRQGVRMTVTCRRCAGRGCRV